MNPFQLPLRRCIGFSLYLLTWGLPVTSGVGTVESNVTTTTSAFGSERAVNHPRDHPASSSHNNDHECELQVAGWNWEEVQAYVVVTVFIFLSGFLKIGFHHAGFFVSKIPESCLLIILGTAAGLVFKYSGPGPITEELQRLKPDLFFLVLLPPIVLEASYSLHDRIFVDNIGSIFMYAVVGTILNSFLLGPILYGLHVSGAMGQTDNLHISFHECLLFSALIVAVDPVAVLAIFQEIKVNHVLYILVFGESLFNDAVTVVIYRTVQGLNCLISEHVEITTVHYVTAVISFFTVSLGGILIGLIMGVICSVLTKYTRDVRIVEPLTIFSTAYMAYILSELFHWSGIIGMITCGLVQANYAFHNVDANSLVTVTYFIKMASASSDCVIFLYLGSNLVNIIHIWNLGFIFWSIFFTLLIRFITIYVITFFLNRFWRVRLIAAREQFIMAYGGLRGAVAFSLASLLHDELPDDLHTMFVTTTLCVILFTVFVQGATIKPLVNLLEVKTAGDQKDDGSVIMLEALNENLIDHLMAGVEEVIGKHGRFVVIDWLTHMDDQYCKHWLQTSPLTRDERIMKTYEKAILEQYHTTVGNFTRVVPGSHAAQLHLPKSASRSGPAGPSHEPPVELDQGSLAERSGATSETHRDTSRNPSITYSVDGQPPSGVSVAGLPTVGLQGQQSHISEPVRKGGSPSRHQRAFSLANDTLPKPEQTTRLAAVRNASELQKLLVTRNSLVPVHRSSRNLIGLRGDPNVLAEILEEKNRRMKRFRNSVSSRPVVTPISGFANARSRRGSVGGRGSISLLTPSDQHAIAVSLNSVHLETVHEHENTPQRQASNRSSSSKSADKEGISDKSL